MKYMSTQIKVGLLTRLIMLQNVLNAGESHESTGQVVLEKKLQRGRPAEIKVMLKRQNESTLSIL